MLMNKHIYYLFLVAAALFFGACSPEPEPEPRPPLADNSAILPFLQQHRPQRQQFVVDAQNPGTITGSNGTQVIFGPQAFTRPDGSAVTGQVQLEMIEIYDRGDMILAQMPPVFNGRLLVTAGEIYLNAKQQGTTLRVTNSRMQLPQKDTIPSASPKELFSGRGANGTWQRPAAGDTVLVDYITADSAASGIAYYEVSFTNDTIGWINVAHVNQTATARAVNGILEGLETYHGFVVYCVYGGGVRAVSPFSVHQNGQIYSTISLPDLIPVTLVAIGKQNDKFYYGEAKFESGPAEIYHHIPVAEIPEPDLVAKLDSL